MRRLASRRVRGADLARAHFQPEIVIGTKRNRLTIVARAEDSIDKFGHKTRMLRVRCDCGVEKTIRSSNFYSDHLKSCGCLKREKASARRLKHGHARFGQPPSNTFSSWNDAKQRCFNSKHRSFHHYGGRGITMCDRWISSFGNFLADMGDCPPGLTIERHDVNGHYEPGNCRWAPKKDQTRNKRNSHFLEFNGQRLTIAEWSERTGLQARRINFRIAAGWPVSEALTLPPDAIGNRRRLLKGRAAA